MVTPNFGKSFTGSKLDGIGFAVEPEEAQLLIQRNPTNKHVLFPYLVGQDLNSSPDQSPVRWAINFFDWELTEAEKYRDCLRIVKERVYPQRQGHSEKRAREYWWQYQRVRPELYQTIASLERTIVIALTSDTMAFTFLPTNIVFSHAVIVLAFDKSWIFAVLQSTIHTDWARRYGSSMKGDARYTPTDCFETFPFPHLTSRLQIMLDRIGKSYYEHRRQIMLARQEGLTKTYNRFHDPDEHSADISRLRALHVEMDQAVAVAYNWDDPSASSGQALELGHGFHKTAQGMRYTISEPARREVLARLLALNHQWYEEERKMQAASQQTDKVTRRQGDKVTRSKKDKGKKAGKEQLGLLLG